MKPVKFFISKLGAIRDSEVELSPLMIFSGESGLGKSYVSFLVHYLYVLLMPDTDNRPRENRLFKFFEKENFDFKSLFEDNEKRNGIILTIKKEYLLKWINSDAITYIAYLLGHKDFEGEVKIELPLDEDLSFLCKENMMGLTNNEEIVYKLSLGSLSYNLPIGLIDNVSSVFNLLLIAYIRKILFGDFLSNLRTFLMPPSRGSLVELNLKPAFLSGMYEEFFDTWKDLERPLKDVSYQIPQSLSECLSDINTGSLQRIEGKIIYQTTNGDSMPITAAASSIKELAPLSMFFQKCSPKDASILFEEPEAHLHPARQIKVADLIGCAIGLGSHIQITTHSDYFLTQINNLIKLYYIKEKNLQKFNEICTELNFKEESIINPTSVRAYVLRRRDDGSTEILNQEIGKEGIPFTSFYDVINSDLHKSHVLNKALEE